MNWYSLVKIQKAIDSSGRQTGSFSKTASLNEIEWGVNVADFQRWVVDAVEIKGYVIKTPYKIAICINIYNDHIQEMMYQEFWKFKTDEISEAKSLFKKLCSKMESITDEFRKKEIPNNLIHSYFRKELRKIDSEHLPKSNIPSINYALDVSYEADWRSTIYGTRYPTRDTSGF